MNHEVKEISYFDSIQSKRYFNGNFKIIAMATSTAVYIGFVLYKSINIAFEFSVVAATGEPPHNDARQPYTISWGSGSFAGNTRGFPLLCIGYAKFVFLVKAQVFEEEKIRFYQAAYAHFTKIVEKCVFLSNSIIFVMFVDKSACLLHTTDFKLGKVTKTELEKKRTVSYHLDHRDELERV